MHTTCIKLLIHLIWNTLIAIYTYIAYGTDNVDLGSGKTTVFCQLTE